ncbi:MAG: Asp23/Gls24 family envelope stress response protein [Schaedlerella sp.]|nr:Asp23/Gls24 family envelope stress response protein [Schaedlerella sp.]
MAKDEKITYTIQNESSLGEVQIADDVVAIIAAYAAADVKGVASVAGNTAKERINKRGMKNPSRGVKVDVLDGVVTVSMSLIVKYGFSIVNVTKNVQEKVKSTIENMTSLEVADINIRVAGVEMEPEV